MIVEAQLTINASRAAVWAAITNIESASETITGIDKIEVLEKPANGLVGLKWRETRMLFGKPATAEKWITDAGESEFYMTRAEDQGCVYLCTRRLTESNDGITVHDSHESRPQGLAAKLMLASMGFLFRGVAKKAILRDLQDIKAAVEEH